MTLQQLKYAVITEVCGSISDAAEKLFIAQPSLSKSIRLLEEELGFALFVRERKGVKATPQGMEFLCYAKRVLEQSDRLEERFGKDHGKGAYYTRRIHISAQPVYRAIEAFSAVLKEYGGSEYTFTLTCDSLLQVIENVLSRKSELGVIYIYDDERKMLEKIFRDNELEFIPAYETVPVAWMWVEHPLAKKAYVTSDEIGQWPVVSYEAISPGTASLSGNIDFGKTFSKNIHLTSDSDITCILKNIMGIYISGKDFLREEKEIVTGFNIPFDEKDGKYYISGLPWFSAIESSQAGHFSEDDQLQLTANDHFSDGQRKKVEKFLKVFFTNYTTNQDNLNLIAKDVDIIANTTFKTIDYTYLKKDGQNLIAYVQATFEVGGTTHSENFTFTLSEKDKSYYVTKLEHTIPLNYANDKE